MLHGLVGRFALALIVVATAGTAGADRPDFACRNVTADGGWQSTGITVAEGDAVCVAADGFWSHGKEAGDITPWHGAEGYLYKRDRASPPIVPFPFAEVGALIGKLGDTGLAFPVGDALCFVAGETDGNSGLPADLQLTINDAPASFEDNRGALQVAVAVHEARGNDAGAMGRLGKVVSRGSCLR
jgi:hypothetical protein